LGEDAGVSAAMATEARSKVPQLYVEYTIEQRAISRVCRIRVETQ
jgi:hypothetical protein